MRQSGIIAVSLIFFLASSGVAEAAAQKKKPGAQTSKHRAVVRSIPAAPARKAIDASSPDSVVIDNRTLTPGCEISREQARGPDGRLAWRLREACGKEML